MTNIRTYCVYNTLLNVSDNHFILSLFFGWNKSQIFIILSFTYIGRHDEFWKAFSCLRIISGYSQILWSSTLSNPPRISHVLKMTSTKPRVSIYPKHSVSPFNSRLNWCYIANGKQNARPIAKIAIDIKFMDIRPVALLNGQIRKHRFQTHTHVIHI